MDKLPRVALLHTIDSKPKYLTPEIEISGVIFCPKSERRCEKIVMAKKLDTERIEQARHRGQKMKNCSFALFLSNLLTKSCFFDIISMYEKL